jgi:hypothetical protein
MRNRVARGRENAEECIPLRVDLDAVVRRERTAEERVVLRESIGIGRIPERLQQRRGALDIREEKRDRSSRKRTSHETMMRQDEGVCSAAMSGSHEVWRALHEPPPCGVL